MWSWRGAADAGASATAELPPLAPGPRPEAAGVRPGDGTGGTPPAQRTSTTPHRWAGARRTCRSWAGPAAVVAVVVTVGILATTGALDGVPLLDSGADVGPEAIGAETGGVLLLAASWVSRDLRWWRWRLPATLLAAAALTGAIAVYLAVSGTVTDPYPPSFAVWVALMLAAVIGAPMTVRRGGQLRRCLSLAAIPGTIVGGFLLVNDHYGVWPTVADLFGHDVSAASLSQALHLPPGSVSPDKGVLATLDVPARRSHFPHRTGAVYLPPAYFTAARRSLPVLIMMGGTPGSPTGWVGGGHAEQIANAYAAAHHGRAPVMLFVDQNGSATGDTECVNGPRGQAETYLTVDVPTFVTRTLRIPRNPAHWGVVGFSEGGTCALDLVLDHPNLFRHFVDLAGDLRPNLGDAQHTLQALFGGSRTAQANHDPRHLLATRHYHGVTGWICVGAGDHRHLAVAATLRQLALHDGLKVRGFTGIGAHNWQFASSAFQRLLPQLLRDMGLH